MRALAVMSPPAAPTWAHALTEIDIGQVLRLGISSSGGVLEEALVVFPEFA